MILGGWRSHHHAWTTYRKQRENILRELDEFPCAAEQAQGCTNCCGAATSKVEFLLSCLRALAMSEDYHLIMHRQQLNEQLARRQRREQAKLRRVA